MWNWECAIPTCRIYASWMLIDQVISLRWRLETQWKLKPWKRDHRVETDERSNHDKSLSGHGLLIANKSSNWKQPKRTLLQLRRCMVLMYYSIKHAKLAPQDIRQWEQWNALFMERGENKSLLVLFDPEQSSWRNTRIQRLTDIISRRLHNPCQWGKAWYVLSLGETCFKKRRWTNVVWNDWYK